MAKFEVVNHPLIQHKLTIIRDKDCSTKVFREVTNEIGMLMAYEITRDLPLEDIEIETPIMKTTQKQIAGKKLAIRSEEHTSELQSRFDLVCRLLLEKKNKRG